MTKNRHRHIQSDYHQHLCMSQAEIERVFHPQSPITVDKKTRNMVTTAKKESINMSLENSPKYYHSQNSLLNNRQKMNVKPLL